MTEQSHSNRLQIKKEIEELKRVVIPPAQSTPNLEYPRFSSGTLQENISVPQEKRYS